jgi:hypothetical protein
VLGRLVERQPEDVLDDDLVREADAQDEAPARRRLRAHRLLRHVEGMARVRRHDAGAELDARHLVAGHGDRRHGVDAEDVRHPRRVEARRLRCLHVLDDLVDRRPANADPHSHGAGR